MGDVRIRRNDGGVGVLSADFEDFDSEDEQQLVEIPDQSSQGGLQQADDEDYQITAQVLDLLKDEPVTEATREKLRGHLNNYALQMRGMERGRDMTRAAIKARDAKVGELQARVGELENECRTNREKIRSLSSGIRALVKGADDDE